MSLRASQVAEAAGVNRETLRYYERRGLLSAPTAVLAGTACTTSRPSGPCGSSRPPSGWASPWTRSLTLIEAGRRRGRDSSLQTRAAEKLAEVEARIEDLTLIKANLQAAIAAGCDDLHRCAANDCCPIPFVDLAEVTTVERTETR
jgi:hypothetical protein